MLTQNRLRDVLEYNQETGDFIWKAQISKRMGKGKTAGRLLHGYIQIGIDGKRYPAHRLAFLYVQGSFPSGHVDHIDGNRSNNRWVNLRNGTVSENAQNKRSARKGSKTNLIGSCIHAQTGKYQAQIKLNGVNHYLGLFETAEQAHEAYLSAKRNIHPFCTI